MNIQRILGTAALVAAFAACSREPAKDVQSAQTNLTNAEVNARRDSVRLDEQQEAERAAADKARAEELNSAQKEVTQAQARLEMERQNVTESSKLRLERLTADANGLKQKSTTLSRGKKAEFDTLWNRYELQRQDVKNQIDDLGNVQADAWVTSKKTLNDSLDNLSKTISKIDDVF